MYICFLKQYRLVTFFPTSLTSRCTPRMTRSSVSWTNLPTKWRSTRTSRTSRSPLTWRSPSSDVSSSARRIAWAWGEWTTDHSTTACRAAAAARPPTTRPPSRERVSPPSRGRSPSRRPSCNCHNSREQRNQDCKDFSHNFKDTNDNNILYITISPKV